MDPTQGLTFSHAQVAQGNINANGNRNQQLVEDHRYEYQGFRSETQLSVAQLSVANINESLLVVPNLNANNIYDRGFVSSPTISETASCGVKRGRGRPPKDKTNTPNTPGPDSKNQRTHTCSICNKTFTALSSLIRHKTTHTQNPTPFCCQTCNKKYTQASSLAEHIKRAHEGSHVTCPICGRKIARKRYLVAHLKVHEKLDRQEKDSDSDDFLSGTRSLRVQIDEPPLKCPKCGKGFFDAAALGKHARIHSEELRPHQCPHCNKRFNTAAHLNQHISDHFRNFSYKSKYCERKFRRRFERKVHQLFHEEFGICKPERIRGLTYCKLCSDSESGFTPFLFKEHFKDRHQNGLSIPVVRFEVKPLEKEEMLSSNEPWLLCNNCGNVFWKREFKFHLSLCAMNTNGETEMSYHQEISNEADVEVNNLKSLEETLWTPIEESCDDYEHDHTFENNHSPINEDQTYNPEFNVNESQLYTSEFNVNESQTNTSDFNENFGSCMENDNIFPEIKLEINNDGIVPTSGNSFLQNPSKSPVLSLPRLQFKALLYGQYRAISIIRPSTVSVQSEHLYWYICAKCGRTYKSKYKAKVHKSVCIKRNNYKLKSLEEHTNKVPRTSGTQNIVVYGDGSFIELDPFANQNQAPPIKLATELVWSDRLDSDLIGISPVTKPNFAIAEPKRTRNRTPDPRIIRQEDGLYLCTICGKTVKSGRTHVIIHEEKKHVCDICGLAFMWRSEYTAHKLRHTVAKPFACRTCGKAFPHVTGRWFHEKTHQSPELKYPCKTCGKLFHCLMTRYSHGIVCSGGSRPRSQNIQQRIPYTCNLCFKVVKGTKGLKLHMAMLHPINGVKPSFFTCTVCQKGFSTGSNFKCHFLNTHKEIFISNGFLRPEDKLYVSKYKDLTPEAKEFMKKYVVVDKKLDKSRDIEGIPAGLNS